MHESESRDRTQGPQCRLLKDRKYFKSDVVSTNIDRCSLNWLAGKQLQPQKGVDKMVGWAEEYTLLRGYSSRCEGLCEPSGLFCFTWNLLLSASICGYFPEERQYVGTRVGKAAGAS